MMTKKRFPIDRVPFGWLLAGIFLFAFSLAAAFNILLELQPFSELIGESRSPWWLYFAAFSMVVAAFTLYSRRYARKFTAKDTIIHRDAFFEDPLIELRKRSANQPYLGLAVVDIDFFKKYNDAYGYPAGDEAVSRVANALRYTLRNKNEKVIRWGDQEFVVLFSMQQDDEMPILLDRIVKGVNDLEISHEGSPYHQLTISAGAVVKEWQAAGSMNDLYSLADNALCDAKDSGRNRWTIE